MAGIAQCNGKKPSSWRLGAAYGLVSTRIRFDLDGGYRFDNVETASLRKHSLTVLAEQPLTERWTLQFGLGLAVTGELKIRGERHRILPGPVASIAGSFRILDGNGPWPFVILSASFGASVTWTRQEGVARAGRVPMIPFDLRGTIAVGKTFFGRLSPYLAARYFDLPVLWTLDGQRVLGADDSLYQLAVGIAVTLPPVDVVVEIAPIGERAVIVVLGLTL